MQRIHQANSDRSHVTNTIEDDRRTDDRRIPEGSTNQFEPEWSESTVHYVEPNDWCGKVPLPRKSPHLPATEEKPNQFSEKGHTYVVVDHGVNRNLD